MTLRQLIAKSGLRVSDLDREIVFFNDEELNQGFTEAEIAEDSGTKKLMLYPLSGTEIE